MTPDKCAYCSSYVPKDVYCVRHLCGIENILSCTAAGDATTKKKREDGDRGVTDSCFATIPREDSHTVFDKKDETLPECQRKILVDFLKNLRKSVMYGDHDGEFELGFFRGWVTACNAALAIFGVDPHEK